MSLEFLRYLIVLAEVDGPAEQPSFWIMNAPWIMIVALFFLIVWPEWRKQSQQKSQVEEMLKNLKKNDRVVTIGGIIGTITNVSSDGAEITVRVDDNARIRFERRAILKVLLGSEPDANSTST